MAAISHVTTVSSNSAGSSISTSGTHDPNAGDLFIIAVFKANSTNTGTVTDNFGDGGAYTLIRTAQITSGATRNLLVFVRDTLAPTATDRTWTYDCAGDDWTTMRLSIAKVTGMSKTGALAVRQSGEQNDVASGTPNPSFDTGACLTTNPVMGFLMNLTNPAGITEPASWTEHFDAGNTSPTGQEAASLDSGLTGSSVAWGSASPSRFADIVLEFDASSAEPTETYFRYHKA